MVGLRVATRVAFVMALTLFLAHGPTFGACSSWSYFTIIGKDNSPLKVGCQGQAYQSLRPWGKGEKIVQLEINTICKQQEWHNYFHDLDKETVKDKIVLVQFSDCLETWFQYEQTFFHVTAYLSLQTQARGIIIAERYRGKLPDSVVIEEKLHDFMDPVCIITGESYEQMIDAFSTSKSFDGTLEADMSSVLFFSSDTSDEEEVSAYESSIRQALKMWEAMSGSNAEALQTFTEAFEFYYPLKHYHNGSLFEMPLRRAETLGPRTSPEISAELVVAELTDACFQDSYSACSSCFQANSSERFQNAEALDGKVALVLVDAPWLGVQGCFRNYEDYPILLQELGVRGVILTSTSFSLPQEAWPMVDVKIPVFSIPYNYGVYLRKGFFDARPTDMLDDVSVFPFPEGNTEVVLPEYGEELDLQKAMMMKLLNEYRHLPLGCMPTTEIWHTREKGWDNNQWTEMARVAFDVGDAFGHLYCQDSSFTIWETAPENLDDQRTQGDAGGVQPPILHYSTFVGSLDSFYSSAYTGNSIENQSCFDFPESVSVGNDGVAKWVGMRVLRMEPADHCVPTPYHLEKLSRKIAFCRQDCGTKGFLKPLENATTFEDVALYMDVSDHPCLPTATMYLELIEGLITKGQTNVRVLLIAHDSKIMTFDNSTKPSFPIINLGKKAILGFRQFFSQPDSNKKEVYISRNAVERESIPFFNLDYMRNLLLSNALVETTAEGNDQSHAYKLLSTPLRDYYDTFVDKLCRTGKLKAARIIHPQSSENFSELHEETYRRTPIELAGAAKENAPDAFVSGEVVLVEAHINCSMLDCKDCHETFSDYDLRGKIAFFPFSAADEGFLETLSPFFNAIDQNETVRELLRPQEEFLESFTEGMFDAYRSSCLRPVYKLVELLKARGAKAVVFGNFKYQIFETTLLGSQQQVGTKIPVFNINNMASAEWYRILKHTNGRLVVDIGSCTRISALTLGHDIQQIRNPHPHHTSEALHRTERVGGALPGQGMIIATSEAEGNKEKGGEDSEWAYKLALWCGVALVCVAAFVVGMLIKHYRGRLSLTRARGQTVDLSTLPAAQRNQNTQQRSPYVIYEQGTYGWGPFRDRSRRSRSYL